MSHTVKQVLNNNAIIVLDDLNDIELLIMDKGVGFNCKVNTPFDISKVENIYYLDRKSEREMLERVNTDILSICNDILVCAKQEINQNIDADALLPLADHLQYAIKRMRNNNKLPNPFLHDIKMLFPKEYEVAKKGKQMVKERLDVELDVDEISYITLHIHSALSSDSVSDSLKKTQVIQECIDIIEKELNIKVNYESSSYLRLLNHLKYLIVRLEQNEYLDMDIDDFMEKQFPEAYKVGIKVINYLKDNLEYDIPKSEVNYLAVHIQRILLNSNK